MTPPEQFRPSLLWFAVPAAFAVRLTFQLVSNRAIDAADSIHYIAMAQQFAAGEFFSFDENLPVLYSALAAVAHLAIPDWEAAFRAISLIASSLVVIPVYRLSRELHGDGAARVMALLTVLWPWLIDYASRIQPESLAVLLWFTSVWLVYRAVAHGGIHLVLAPLALFALHLARPEGTLLMIAAPVGALALAYRADRTRVRRVIMLGLIVAAAAVGYMLAMRVVIGTATLSYRAPMAGDVLDYFRRGGVEVAGTFFELTFNVLPVMLGPFLLVFMGVGLFSQPERGRQMRLELFIAFFCFVQYAVALANFSPAPRYLMPIVVAGGLWAAWGLERARTIIAATHRPRLAYAPLLLVVGAFALAIAASVAMDRIGMPTTPVEYRIAGRWMHAHLDPGLILSRKPQVGFYAGMPTTGPAATDDVSALLSRARETGARYVVVDERYTAALVPGIASLLDPANAPAELKVLRDDLSEWPEARIVVYEVAIPGMRYLPPEEFPRPDSHMGPDARRRTAPAPTSE